MNHQNWLKMGLDVIRQIANHLTQAMHANLLNHFALSGHAWCYGDAWSTHHPPKLFASDLLGSWFVLWKMLVSSCLSPHVLPVAVLIPAVLQSVEKSSGSPCLPSA